MKLNIDPEVQDDLRVRLGLARTYLRSLDVERFGYGEDEMEEKFIERAYKLRVKLGFLGMRFSVYSGLRDYCIITKVIDNKTFYGLIRLSDFKIVIPVEYNTLTPVVMTNLTGFFVAKKFTECDIYDMYCNHMGRYKNQEIYSKTSEHSRVYGFRGVDGMLLIDKHGIYYKKIPGLHVGYDCCIEYSSRQEGYIILNSNTAVDCIEASQFDRIDILPEDLKIIATMTDSEWLSTFDKIKA